MAQFICIYKFERQSDNSWKKDKIVQETVNYQAHVFDYYKLCEKAEIEDKVFYTVVYE